VKTLTYTSFLGIFCLVAELLNLRKLLIPLVVLGLVAIAGLSYTELHAESASHFYDMLRTDDFSVSFSILLILITALIISLGSKFYSEDHSKLSDYVALIVFALCGAIAMVSFANMAMFYIGIEILSISFYILAGTNKRDVRSNEAAMKYFLMGAFASGILLMGITLIYGASGSFNLGEIAGYATSGNADAIFYIGIILILIGLLFKVSAAPFHFWAPDVYEGSPMLITALMSTLGKVASFAAFYRLFIVCFVGNYVTYGWVLSVVIALTIVIGNFSALRQHSFKRMLAFSGVANAGFMLMAISSIYGQMEGPLFFYGFSYSLATIGAFAIALYVSSATKSEKIEAFNGLAYKRPLLAVLLIFSMLSIAGIPPFAGFFAKYFLFAEALKSGHFWLVMFAIINSIISVYYYFKVILALFSKSEQTFEEQPSPIYVGVGLVAVILLILAGVAPGLFMPF
jgi:NADH-quinone oxidoreductase subunit N